MKIQLKRSNVLENGNAKVPTSAQLDYGELAVNYNSGDPTLFLKNSDDTVIKFAGNSAYDDRYVLETGDNMTGNLTLGTNEIVLDASNGSATFATGNTLITSGGSINLDSAGNPASSAKISLNSNGNASFSGTVTATSFSGDGSGLANTGASLSTASGTQRLVLTGLTSGTMTSAATDVDLTFNASNNTLSCPNFSGIASSATKLQTSRTINGTNFNGTANITTSFWGTTRTINGVSVNGSANYTLEPYVERDDSSNATRYITFVDNSTAGYKRLNMDSSLSYNPSTNSISINIGGTAKNGTNVRVDHDTGNNWHRIVMVDDGESNAAYLRLKTDNGSTCAINPSSNQIRATTFVGALSGNASSATNADYATNAGSASSATNATNATNSTNFNVAADNSTNSNHYVIFTGGATGNQRPNSDTAFYYNPSSNTLNAGNFNSTSDIALKTDVTCIDNALSRLCNIEGVGFAWKKTGARTYGVIAQDVEKEFPELVHSEEFKSVNYNGLVGVLIEAIKELKEEIEELKKE